MTAARRSGGRPPSHSHWSITLGQMRSVTAAASCGEAASTCGKVSGRPTRMRTLCGRMRQPLRIASVPITATGTTGRAGLQREPADAAPGAPERAGPDARALGEDQHRVAAGEDRLRGLEHVGVALAAADREGAERVEEPGRQPVAEQLLLGDVVHRPPGDRGDHERVQERAVVGGEDHGPALGHVLAADPRQPEVEVEERLEDRPHEPVDERVDAALAVAGVQVGVIGGRLRHLAFVPPRAILAPAPVVTVAAWPSTRRERCGARLRAQPPRPCGPRSSRSTSACSAWTTTMPSCSGASRACARPPRIRSASRCTSPTAPPSARSTPTSPRACPARAPCAAPPPGSPSTSRPGPGRS